MSRRKKKREPALEIKVSFEASRLACECLASSYEQIVPQVRYCTSTSQEKTNAEPEPQQRQVGGMNG